jgi:tRNA nucleotidyltransferase/poly(A) polymerase
VFTDQQTKCLGQLGQLADFHRIELFLVGGAVRDILRGEVSQDSDLDILVEGDAKDFATKAKDRFGGRLKVFERFFTAKLINPDAFDGIGEIDFASSRSEIYQVPGALPLVKCASLSEDLKRRDFSINATAFSVRLFANLAEGQALSREQIDMALIDPFQGKADLAQGLIRILHSESFRDDPTRMFRALRYVVRVGGALESLTELAFRKAIHLDYLSTISFKRRFNELVKMLLEVDAAAVIQLAADTGLFKSTFINTHADSERFSHVLSKVLEHMGAQVFDSSESVEKLLFFVFFDCTPAAQQEQLFQDLAISKKTQKQLLKEWISLLKGEYQSSYSREAQAVFGAVNDL